MGDLDIYLHVEQYKKPKLIDLRYLSLSFIM